MQKLKTIGLTSILLTLLLTGCAGQKETKEKNNTLSVIDEASQNSANLENGMYTYTSSQNIDDENSIIHGNGIFVQLPDQIMWSTQVVLGQRENETRTLTENFQKSGKLYQRIGLVNEKNDYIEENGVPNWEIVAEESSLLPLYLEGLLEVDILKEDIESIEVSDEGDYTVHELLYTEDYRDSVMKENIQELEAALEKQTAENADDFHINSLKTAIKEQKNNEYTNKRVLVKINKENILFYRLTEDSFNISVNDTVQSGTVTIETMIENYNDPSIGIDIEI